MQQAPQFWSPANKRSELPDSAHLRLFALISAIVLGSVTVKVLTHSTIPVLVYR